MLLDDEIRGVLFFIILLFCKLYIENSVESVAFFFKTLKYCMKKNIYLVAWVFMHNVLCVTVLKKLINLGNNLAVNLIFSTKEFLELICKENEKCWKFYFM